MHNSALEGPALPISSEFYSSSPFSFFHFAGQGRQVKRFHATSLCLHSRWLHLDLLHGTLQTKLGISTPVVFRRVLNSSCPHRFRVGKPTANVAAWWSTDSTWNDGGECPSSSFLLSEESLTDLARFYFPLEKNKNALINWFLNFAFSPRSLSTRGLVVWFWFAVLVAASLPRWNDKQNTLPATKQPWKSWTVPTKWKPRHRSKPPHLGSNHRPDRPTLATAVHQIHPPLQLHGPSLLTNVGLLTWTLKKMSRTTRSRNFTNAARQLFTFPLALTCRSCARPAAATAVQLRTWASSKRWRLWKNRSGSTATDKKSAWCWKPQKAFAGAQWWCCGETGSAKMRLSPRRSTSASTQHLLWETVKNRSTRNLQVQAQAQVQAQRQHQSLVRVLAQTHRWKGSLDRQILALTVRS